MKHQHISLSIPIGISFLFSLFYGFFQMTSIYAGDSGELVTAASLWGVPHPPGYPLYTLLGNILVRIIPFSTEAFRVGFLSSVPMAMSLGILSYLIISLTRSKIAGVMGPILTGLLYPIFLYAIVPEVFGLYAFFSCAFLLCCLMWIRYKHPVLLIVMSFLFGLSMTHHHLILLLIASSVVVFWRSWWDTVRKTRRLWWLLPLAFGLGFSVYIYVPIAASFAPMIDWEHAVTLPNFFRLITRAAYGTFRASYFTGQSLIDRGLNVLTLFQYLWQDMRSIGMIFIFAGAVTLYRRERTFFYLVITYIGFLIFYLFYAGFPVGSNFALGTLERFFVIPYGVCGLLIGVGIGGVVHGITSLWRKKRIFVSSVQMAVLFVILLCMFEVIRVGRLNIFRLAPLKNDRTIETLGNDILASVPQHAILTLQDDLSIFAVQYMLYVKHVRPDIRFILFPHFAFSWNRLSYARLYPDVIFPPFDERTSTTVYIKSFLHENARVHPIVSDWNDQPDTPRWIPEGLVMRYYATGSAFPPAEKIREENIALWSTVSDPFHFALATYRHLLLSDVFRYMAKKHIAFSEWAFDHGFSDLGKQEFMRAVQMIPDQYQLFTRLISQSIAAGSCDRSYDLLSSLSYTPKNAPDDIILLYHDLYDACASYQDRAAPMEQEYRETHPETAIR